MTIKVMLFCVDGFYQRCLAALLSREFELCGVVVRYRERKNKSLSDRVGGYIRDPRGLYRYLGARIALPAYKKRAAATYREYFWKPFGYSPRFPDHCEFVRTSDINHPDVEAFVEHANPDIVCVNGTNLVREPLLSRGRALPFGIINLHSGLSPYTRGGNCNLFALSDRRPEWVGMTVHHIDPGIDSGDIILSARPPLYAKDCYEDIEARAFGMGIHMMSEGIRRLAAGKAKRVRQWQDGKLYLERTGYPYSPWRRLQVNRMLDSGLIREYLGDRERRDGAVRVVGDFTLHNDTAAN